MENVYECCPSFEGERFLLRLVRLEDCAELLKVYSDERAVPLFNSDNCHGDDFHYTTLERMRSAIEFWLSSYEQRFFVRWAIVDQASGEAIGTIELFNRRADDWFDNCGVLRLDLRSDYERAEDIREILKLIIPQAYALFECDRIAMKAVPQAKERIEALEQLGFAARSEKLVGHDGTQYGDYFARMKA